MINVAIYRDGTGEPEIGRTITGLQLIGTNSGQVFDDPIIFPLKLAQPTGETLNVANIDNNQFDPDIDIHIVLTTRELRRRGQTQKALGFGYELTGLCLVDAASSGEYTHTTTAHEVSHSMGFVALDAAHAEGEEGLGRHHCSDERCLMYARLGHERHDTFCVCCKADMTLLSGLNLMRMRHLRRQERKVSTDGVISDRETLRGFYKELRENNNTH